MIMVKASAGLLIEFGVGPSGKWDALSVRLGEGLAAKPVQFEVGEANGRLLARPLDARPVAELVVALGVLVAHEANVLAEVRKYSRLGG
jgi:hypothetical protein